MNFVEVTHDQFFRAVGGPENINPEPFEHCSQWRNISNHEVVGRSEPGWKSAGISPERYFLADSFASRKLGYEVKA